jgi:hypothetical protein
MFQDISVLHAFILLFAAGIRKNEITRIRVEYFGSASMADVYASMASANLPALNSSLPLPLTSPTTLHVPPIFCVWSQSR